MRALLAAVACVAVEAACVRAPAPLDVKAMVAARGPVEARRDLVARVLANPRDVQAHLALATLDDQLGRPSDAIAELEAVERLGGPLGTRWHDQDRARLGRLLLARGRARLARSSPTALADFERAAALGAAATADEIVSARIALATTQLRHVDAKIRAKGRAILAALARPAKLHAAGGAAHGDATAGGAAHGDATAGGAAHGDATAGGAAHGDATAGGAAHGDATAGGAAHGDATAGGAARGDATAGGAARGDATAGGAARGDATAGGAAHGDATAGGAARGDATAGGAAQGDATAGGAAQGDATAGGASTGKAGAEVTEESSWLGARRGATAAERGAFGAWLWTVGARKESFDQLAAWHAATPAPRVETLQVAYLRALAWWSPIWSGEAPMPPASEVVEAARCWFPGGGCPLPGGELVPLAPVELVAEPRFTAFARYASMRSSNPGGARALARIAAGYWRDPAIADRLALDFVGASSDAALAHATLGALFDSLGDPARARAAWQAAVDASPEPAFARGLAEAVARTGDGPAALVHGTVAAAASGDPATTWTAVAVALLESKQAVEALTAAHAAIELAGPETLPHALDVAIQGSRALHRTAQADALALQRAQLAVAAPAEDAESLAALAAHRERPTAVTAARLWVVSRARARDVAIRAALFDALGPDDPRFYAIVDELLALTGDESPERAYAAVSVFRTAR